MRGLPGFASFAIPPQAILILRSSSDLCSRGQQYVLYIYNSEQYPVSSSAAELSLGMFIFAYHTNHLGLPPTPKGRTLMQEWLMTLLNILTNSEFTEPNRPIYSK